MDVGRAFGFVFQDPRWVSKLLIALVMLVIPIFGWFALYGYYLRITRQVVGGTDLPLPEWTDWGGLFVDGLKYFGVTLVWSLLVLIVGIVVQVGGQGGDNPGVAIIGGCLSFLLNVALLLVLPAAIARLAYTNSFAGGLDFGAVFGAVRSNVGDYVIIVLIELGLAIVLGIVGVVAFFLVIGLGAATDSTAFVVLFFVLAAVAGALVGIYLYMIFHHLYGQAFYRANRGVLAPTTGPRF